MEAHLEVNGPEVAADDTRTKVQDRIVEWIIGERGIVADAFRMEGYPLPWKPIKHSTELDKIRHGYNPWADQTRTGALQRAARNPGIFRGPGVVVFVVTGVGFAGFHQTGTRFMPARDPIPAPTEDDCADKAQELCQMILEAEGF